MISNQSICLRVEQNASRLDSYLSQKKTDLSRSRIQQLIEQG
ncbi:MAG: RluA family pseudouridine synthase, partial [Rivularia sp. (in: cyanobacteria)]